KLASVLLLMVAVCLLIAPKNSESLENTIIYDLLPFGMEEDRQVFVPTFDVVPVTADGVLSDLLLPKSIEKAKQFESPHEDKLRILIYHTHLTEAYRQEETGKYKESGEYRTFDEAYNLSAVGEVLKSELEKLGHEVIHDKTNHEPPKLSTAYERSVKTMEKYDGIDLYIDLHRDASGPSNTDDVVVINGERCARMMFVVGQGIRSDGTEYDPKPNFEKTFSLAETISENVKAYDEAFMRDTRIKNGRYNQHISDNCILVEVGHNMNTLTEAKNAVGYLARAIDKTFVSDAEG
ncbi:MAG: stage II sporulation protein P, partial [Christensenellaceae bacterium]|nr:stage II sporulation protein P [Christensenellaceae bacterium]